MYLYYENHTTDRARFYKLSWKQVYPQDAEKHWVVTTFWGTLGSSGQCKKSQYATWESTVKHIQRSHDSRIKNEYERLLRPSMEQGCFEFASLDAAEQMELFDMPLDSLSC